MQAGSKMKTTTCENNDKIVGLFSVSEKLRMGNDDQSNETAPEGRVLDLGRSSLSNWRTCTAAHRASNSFSPIV